MARRPVSRRKLRSSSNVQKDDSRMKSLALEEKEWENAICSVCMESPHNAVLLLCSSHDKGCRPYMCSTDHRYSNCLDQFQKAYAKEISPLDKSAEDAASLDLGLPGWPVCEKSKAMELACPLCRGQVKGWTLVEPARKYLNRKKRSCMQDKCSFRGSYKKLRKHARAEHGSFKSREVDPVLQEKWKKLEFERERADVMSTIRSSMPRSVVLGDYVIDMSDSSYISTDDNDDFGEEDDDDGFQSRRRFRRSLLRVLVRESARIARFRRGEAGGRASSATDAFLSDGDDDYISRGDIMRAERPQVRHRRRGRHGRPLFL